MLATRFIFSLCLFVAHQGVNAFFYRAVPMYDQNGKLVPDSSNIGPSSLRIEATGVGRICSTMQSGIYLINPYAQRCPIGKSKCGPEHDSTLGKCAMYSGCYTISNDFRACSCLPDYFGNPYKQCFRHCDTDLDCPSPYAECRMDAGETIKRCKCRAGCPGDGVICKPDKICTDLAEDSEAHRRCLQTGITDKTYVCDDGYYLDTDNKCQPIVELEDDRVVSVIASGYVNGSRIDIGNCFSIEINKDNGMSYFYQLNSGDPVVIDQKIKTDDQLMLLFEVKANDIIAFTTTEANPSGLTKIFTISNGLKGCKIDSVMKYSPTGAKEHPSGVRVEVKELETSSERQEL
ncbi:12D3 antigen [Babesia bovis T2Bo]|uniref:12D3 antigen n=2 Tax=Babesia bovis TaxID=5865 RepID=A7ARK0_BABBO|nr:12D3 antigen [Babesia bovis T2Bo]EDO07169.1 12D3 antigen [Babesia bovis T2Bo]BAN65320.1 12D3 antigen [Babesia bovis]|eukprot:XP_001610737.1 12D3 antigen [Babesia bovis T2Bo]